MLYPLTSKVIHPPLSSVTLPADSVTTPITVTLIYDDDFTIDQAAPLPSNVAFDASNVGQTKVHGGVSDSYVGSGVMNFPSKSLKVIDAAAARTRLAGRIHYAKHSIGTTTDFQDFVPLGFVGESPAANWWALNEGHGLKVKNTGSPGAVRMRDDSTAYTDGVFAWTNPIAGNATYEWAAIERTIGAFYLLRIDGGDWNMLALEKVTSLAGKIHHRNTSADYTTLDRLCTANTSFVPTPLVQHSFASAITPSDGAGNPETGGDGITGTTSGDLTITSSALQMNSDGEGFVFYETGETQICVTLDCTVYDGSPVGLILRAVDTSNYIAVKVDSTANTISIIEVVAGTPTTLASVDSNATPDFYDLPDATDLVLRAHIDGNEIRAVYGPLPLHLGYVSTTTTRFSTATKAGVLVSKGAAVNSSKATNFIAFAQVQNSLPEMVNT